MSIDNPQDNATVNLPDKPKPAKKKRRKQRQVVCQVCHKSFQELTAEHLRSHGFTLTRYRRAFQSNTRGPGTYTVREASNGGLTVLDLAERIVSDPQVIRDLAGEVTEAIFSTSLREKLRLALVSTIAQRLDSHGKATASLNEIREELTKRWRIAQGGDNGKPTPTKELIAMHQALNIEVRQTEDLLTKTVKMAIDEFRSQKGNVSIGGGLDPLRFTGSAEALPIPSNVGPQDREVIRQLWGKFDQAIQAHRTLDAEHSPSTAADGLPSGDEAADHVTEESAVVAERANAQDPDGSPMFDAEPDDEHSDSAPHEFDEPF